MRSCNVIGCSAWSGASEAIDLLSKTLSLTWEVPVEDDVLTGKQMFAFTVSGAPINPRILIREVEAATATYNAATQRYEAVIDTRDYANGIAEIQAVAEDVEGCLARAVREVEFVNTLASGVRYQVIKKTAMPPSGKVWAEALLKLEKRALNSLPRKWHWVRNAVTAALPATVLVGGEASDTVKQEAFEDLQAVVLETGQVGTTPERTQLYARVRLAPPGEQVYWVQQFTPYQYLSHYLTGCEQVAKLRELESGLWLVFANSPVSEAAAKVFSFDGEKLEEVVDLTGSNAADATDVALLDDKIFVVAPGQLFAIDSGSNEITLELAPRGETRQPRFVEVVDDKLLAIFVNDEAEEEASACYDLTFAAPKRLWTLDDPITRVWSDGEKLWLAAGAKLYENTDTTEDTDTTPALRHTFASAVTALALRYVGLANGDLWRRQGNGWERVVDGEDAIQAVAEWEGVGDELLGVAAIDAPQLLEEKADATWSDGRTIEPGAGMGETIETITALARYEKILKPAQGQPGYPGYVAAEKKLALLIGTGDDGVLSVLELSPLNEEAGAFLYSEGNRPSIDVYGEVPESEDTDGEGVPGEL